MTAMHLSARHGSGRDVDTDSTDWRMRAVCRTEDPELFWPVGTSGPALAQAMKAKAVCKRCPVMNECYQWGVETRMGEGVWGGTTEEDRRHPARSAERRRLRSILDDARVLAFNRGTEVLVACEKNSDLAALCDRLGVRKTVVKQALRYLRPEGELPPSAQSLEKVMYQGVVLRELVDAGRSDRDISVMMRTLASTVAEARILLAHQDAAREQTGQVAA